MILNGLFFICIVKVIINRNIKFEKVYISRHIQGALLLMYCYGVMFVIIIFRFRKPVSVIRGYILQLEHTFDLVPLSYILAFFNHLLAREGKHKHTDSLVSQQAFASSHASSWNPASIFYPHKSVVTQPTQQKPTLLTSEIENHAPFNGGGTNLVMEFGWMMIHICVVYVMYHYHPISHYILIILLF
jgi:hypothetical protein